MKAKSGIQKGKTNSTKKAIVNIVEGAGGKITDKYGKPVSLKSDGSLIASSSANLHEEIINIIHK